MTATDEIRCTVLADGRSDDALVPIISWSLTESDPSSSVVLQWADLGRVRNPPRKLAARIVAACDLYPCELLFIHRDAEKESSEERVREIRAAFSDAKVAAPHVCVVPVRMMEAWLLFNEAAIRRAAGNPYGQVPLALPASRTIETLVDPKETLAALLQAACELKGRRLKDFRVLPRRVAELIEDFSPLRELPAFRQFEQELRQALQFIARDTP